PTRFAASPSRSSALPPASPAWSRSSRTRAAPERVACRHHGRKNPQNTILLPPGFCAPALASPQSLLDSWLYCAAIRDRARLASSAESSLRREQCDMNRITTGLAAGLLGIGIVAGFASVPTTTAHAQAARDLIGTLTCRGGPNVGMIVGSQQTLDCSFQPAGNSRARRYSATMTKVGLDVGFKNETTLVWQVIGSTQVRR